jgi:hypothetical protein
MTNVSLQAFRAHVRECPHCRMSPSLRCSLGRDLLTAACGFDPEIHSHFNGPQCPRCEAVSRADEACFFESVGFEYECPECDCKFFVKPSTTTIWTSYALPPDGESP